jgi:C_GCAxxG_C_C family probable redox protein
MTRASKAASLISNSEMNCAQSVLSVFCDELGLDKSAALQVALAFGAGMGRTGGMCGAVTGAYMVLGLRSYPELDSAVAKKEKVYGLASEFNKRFKAINKSLNCTELLGCNLGTPEGRNAARSSKVSSSLCPKLVADAVALLEEMA